MRSSVTSDTLNSPSDMTCIMAEFRKPMSVPSASWMAQIFSTSRHVIPFLCPLPRSRPAREMPAKVAVQSGKSKPAEVGAVDRKPTEPPTSPRTGERRLGETCPLTADTSVEAPSLCRDGRDTEANGNPVSVTDCPFVAISVSVSTSPLTHPTTSDLLFNLRNHLTGTQHTGYR